MVRRFIIIILFILICTNSKAQTKDTAYHYIGVGSGMMLRLYSYHTIEVFHNHFFPIEFNLNYMYCKKRFIFKLDGGITPENNYGNVIKIYPTIGSIISIDKNIKFHYGIGIGSLFGTATYDYTKFFKIGLIANTGLLISPFKDKAINITLDISGGGCKETRQTPYNGPLSGQTEIYRSAVLFYNVSIIYRLQKKTKFKLFKYVD